MRNARYKFAIVFALALALLATVFGAKSAAAQGVLGIVYDAESHRAIVGAEVFLFAQGGELVASAVTASSGRFFLAVGEYGTYDVIAASLGYHTNLGSQVEFGDRGMSWVEIELAPDAIEIPGLVVTQERYVRILDVRGYYTRKRQSLGQFVEPSAFEKSMHVPFRELLRQTAFSGTLRRCRIGLIINGSPARGGYSDSRLRARYIAGIELYRSAASAPAEFVAMVPRACAIVAVWLDFTD